MAGLGSIEQRFDLITRRIAAEDIHDEDLIKTALAREGKSPKCLWGVYAIPSRFPRCHS